MKTKVSSITELKSIVTELILNETNKLSKLSVGSVFNAVAYGIAKIGQKALREIAIVESQLFPEYAVGNTLDIVAKRYGIFSRLGANQSSVYIYLYADQGTVYSKNSCSFTSNDGITFILNNDVTIDSNRYAYALATSVESGEKANVTPLSITSCINAPAGHKFCTNTFAAYGGRNVESDDEFRTRIENVTNSISTKTFEYLTQVALNFNSNILKFVHLGTYQGKTKLGVYTQSGSALSDEELTNLAIQMREYLALSDISENLEQRVYFANVEYAPIDISLKISYMSDLYSINDIYSAIQKKLISYVDYRYLNTESNISWINLYELIKNTEGIINVNYGDFLINGGQSDVIINKSLLPRFRQMLIYDLDGNSLLDTGITSYMPFIYPNYRDLNYENIL